MHDSGERALSGEDEGFNLKDVEFEITIGHTSRFILQISMFLKVYIEGAEKAKNTPMET